MAVIPDILYCISRMRIVGKIIDIILTRFTCFLHEGIKNNTLVLPLYIFIYQTKMHLPTLTLTHSGY
jgi:hypothetical protein